jgi:hypothetical protein
VSGGRRGASRDYGSVDGGVASEPVEVTRTTAIGLRGCVLGVMLVVLPNLGCPLVVGEATNHIRTHIDRMYQLVAKTGSTTESREAVQKARRSDVQLERDGRKGPSVRTGANGHPLSEPSCAVVRGGL